MVVFGQSDSIRAKKVLLVQKWLYSYKMVVLGLKWLYSRKWFYSGKMVVFGKKWL